MIDTLIEIGRLAGAITTFVAGTALLGNAAWVMVRVSEKVWMREWWIQVGAGYALLHGATEAMLRVMT